VEDEKGFHLKFLMLLWKLLVKSLDEFSHCKATRRYNNGTCEGVKVSRLKKWSSIYIKGGGYSIGTMNDDKITKATSVQPPSDFPRPTM